jgi:acyl carrier protein
MSVADRVIAVAENLSGKEAYIDSDLVEDLELDSLDRVQLAMELEEEFDIVIPDEDVDRPELGRISGLTEYIERKIAPTPTIPPRFLAPHLNRPGAEL